LRGFAEEKGSCSSSNLKVGVRGSYLKTGVQKNARRDEARWEMGLEGSSWVPSVQIEEKEGVRRYFFR